MRQVFVFIRQREGGGVGTLAQLAEDLCGEHNLKVETAVSDIKQLRAAEYNPRVFLFSVASFHSPKPRAVNRTVY